MLSALVCCQESLILDDIRQKEAASQVNIYKVRSGQSEELQHSWAATSWPNTRSLCHRVWATHIFALLLRQVSMDGGGWKFVLDEEIHKSISAPLGLHKHQCQALHSASYQLTSQQIHCRR